MAAEPITNLNGGVEPITLDVLDKLAIADVSDTTQAPTGTTKPVSLSKLVTFFDANLNFISSIPTHTGDVTGDTALTLESVAITGQTTVTGVSGDFVLISDTSDSGNLKKVDVVDFLGGGNTLYTADDSLTGARTVTMGGNTLNFSGGYLGINATPVVGTALRIAGGTPSAGAGFLFTLNTGQERFKITDEGATIITRNNANPAALGTNTLTVYGSSNTINTDIASFSQSSGTKVLDIGVGTVGIGTARVNGNVLTVGGDTQIDGDCDATTYSVNGTAGANFSGAVTNITVVDGIVTAVS